MSTYSNDIIIQTLEVLQKKGVRRDKVMLHKFLFFMERMGLPSGMSFEPYTYGPFSFDLANNLDFMCLSDELSTDEYGYKANAPWKEAEFTAKIDKYLDQFIQCVGGVENLTFKALECVGTLLYCYLALKKSGAKLNDYAITDEFKNWKGEKYPDETIKNYLARLHEANVI